MSDENPKVNFDLPWPVERTTGGLVLTSKPYPIEVTENLAVAFGVPRMRFMPGDTEELDLNFSVETLQLRPVLQQYDEGDTEEIDLDFNVESLELREALHEYTIDTEEIDLDFNVESLQLAAFLVEHEQPTEELDLNWAVTSLELS